MVVTWSSLQDEKLRDLDLRFKVMLYMAHGRLRMNQLTEIEESEKMA